MTQDDTTDPNGPQKRVNPKKWDLSAFEGLGLDTDDAGLHGPLSLLKGTWHGNTGFNAMTVPRIDGQDKFLANAYFQEVMTFSAIDQLTPNRGVGQTQMVSALKYETKVVARAQIVEDKNDHLRAVPEKELHFENGLFLNRMTADGKPQISRLLSVPHGDSVLAPGTATALDVTGGKITFGTFNASVPDLFRFLGQDFFDSPELSKMAPMAAAGEDKRGFLPAGTVPSQNMQKALEAETGNNTVIAAIELNFDTVADDGSIQNIAFIDRMAPTSRLKANYWVQRMRPPGGDPKGGDDFAQLQYAQDIHIEFNGFTWPHIIVHTLVRTDRDITRVPWEDYSAADHPNWFKAKIDAMTLAKLEIEFAKAGNRDESTKEMRSKHHNNSALEHYILTRMHQLGHP